VDGPAARELFFLCQPPARAADAGGQAEAIYRAVLAVLAAEGGSFESVVCETLFLRSLRADLEPVRAARERVLAACEAPHHRPAITEIEQPPLSQRALEISVQAVLSLPTGPPLQVDTFEARHACGCAECARSHGLRVHIGDEARLYAGGLYGTGDAYQQALAIFGVAENLLQQAGMEFRDVVRTWIHLREIDRDYGDLNRARRAFFEARGIDPVPASTGIGGRPVPEDHDLCLALYAVRATRPPLLRSVRTVMNAPTLNEAASYGSDFARGMRVVETNKVALHVSGTASIDEAGRTAHPMEFEAQAARMLQNVAALLAGQGASFGDVVSAVTYLKRPADAGRLREKLHEAGFEGFPNVLVAAPICRPDLLCETEVLAVLPMPARS
jgi:enamine deaminase RidA (YjgF/YER057c/UK114 family)